MAHNPLSSSQLFVQVVIISFVRKPSPACGRSVDFVLDQRVSPSQLLFRFMLVKYFGKSYKTCSRKGKKNLLYAFTYIASCKALDQPRVCIWVKKMTKSLIRPHRCAGRSRPLLSA